MGLHDKGCFHGFRSHPDMVFVGNSQKSTFFSKLETHEIQHSQKTHIAIHLKKKNIDFSEPFDLTPVFREGISNSRFIPCGSMGNPFFSHLFPLRLSSQRLVWASWRESKTNEKQVNQNPPVRWTMIWMSPKISGTPKWMVKIMENPIKMDDLGIPLFLETPIYFWLCLRILDPDPDY